MWLMHSLFWIVIATWTNGHNFTRDEWVLETADIQGKKLRVCVSTGLWGLFLCFLNFSVSQANLLRPKGVSIFDDTRLGLHCAELNPLWIFNWKAQNSRFHSVHNSAHTVCDRQVWHPPCGSRLKSQGSIWLLWLLDSRALHWMTLIEAQRGLSHMMMHNNALQQSSCN